VLQPLKETFRPEDYPELLVGLAAADDAAAYSINDEQVVVATTDFFPPVVDDPYDFGAIAAANALSDIYAMGGRPLFALNLFAFPDGMDLKIMREILRGGAEKVAEAGAVIAGGHSIKDEEPKYGMAVTGIVDRSSIKTKGGSRPGDLLVLTKSLGTGVVTTALKRQIATENDVQEAVKSMKLLNSGAAEAADLAGVTSMTDVTGFGLLGHAHEMAHLGFVDFRIFHSALKWLPGVESYARRGAFPGGKDSNRDYFQPWVRFGSTVSQLIQDSLWTPETSGGILAAVSPGKIDTLLQHYPLALVIGEVINGDGHIEVVD
jgi:selenide,water dikinase